MGLRDIAHSCNLGYACYMSVTQSVNIPASHRLIIDVPHEIPVGPAILTFTPASASSKSLQAVKKQTDNPNRKPISCYFGILSPGTYGNGVAYQRKIRDDWDD